MKPHQQTNSSTTNRKRYRVGAIALLILLVQMFGIVRCPAPPVGLRRATQAEADAGANVSAYMNPYLVQLELQGVGSPTGGVTQVQMQGSLKSFTNDYNGRTFNVTNTSDQVGITLTSAHTTSGEVMQLGATRQGSSGQIALVKATSFVGTGIAANSLLTTDANKMFNAVANSAGTLTNDGSGGLGWLSLSSLAGSTTWANVSGGTVNTNPDTATFFTIQDPNTSSRLAQFNQAYFYVQATNPASASFPDYAELFVNNGSSANNRSPVVRVQGDNGKIQYAPSFGGTGYSTTIDATGITTEGQISTPMLVATTAWLTNTVAPTNSLVRPTADFAKSSWMTNLTGDITFTDATNGVAGADNWTSILARANGANRAVTWPSSWDCTPNVTLSSKTFTITNGTKMQFLIEEIIGETTNVCGRVIQ